MRIRVDSPNEKPVRINIPTSLLFNGVTATIGGQIIKSKADLPEGLDLSAAQLRRLSKVLRDCKRKYGDLRLVEVESADGEIVHIDL